MFQEVNIQSLEVSVTALVADLYASSLTPDQLKALVCGAMAAILLNLGGGAAAAGVLSAQNTALITDLASTVVAKTATN